MSWTSVVEVLLQVENEVPFTQAAATSIEAVMHLNILQTRLLNGGLRHDESIDSAKAELIELRRKINDLTVK